MINEKIRLNILRLHQNQLCQDTFDRCVVLKILSSRKAQVRLSYIVSYRVVENKPIKL